MLQSKKVGNDRGFTNWRNAKLGRPITNDRDDGPRVKPKSIRPPIDGERGNGAPITPAPTAEEETPEAKKKKSLKNFTGVMQNAFKNPIGGGQANPVYQVRDNTSNGIIGGRANPAYQVQDNTSTGIVGGRANPAYRVGGAGQPAGPGPVYGKGGGKGIQVNKPKDPNKPKVPKDPKKPKDPPAPTQKFAFKPNLFDQAPPMGAGANNPWLNVPQAQSWMNQPSASWGPPPTPQPPMQPMPPQNGQWPY